MRKLQLILGVSCACIVTGVAASQSEEMPCYTTVTGTMCSILPPKIVGPGSYNCIAYVDSGTITSIAAGSLTGKTDFGYSENEQWCNAYPGTMSAGGVCVKNAGSASIGTTGRFYKSWATGADCGQSGGGA